jgi:Omp85 superfamily domain
VSNFFFSFFFSHKKVAIRFSWLQVRFPPDFFVFFFPRKKKTRSPQFSFSSNMSDDDDLEAYVGSLMRRMNTLKRSARLTDATGENWQQALHHDRLARRFAESDERVALRNVRVDGAKHTKESLIEYYLQPLMGAQTFEELASALVTFEQDMRSLDLFESVDVELDIDVDESNSIFTAQSHGFLFTRQQELQESEASQESDHDIVDDENHYRDVLPLSCHVHISERQNRKKLSIGGSTGGSGGASLGDAGAELTGRLLNVWGGGETLQASGSMSTGKSSNFSVSLSKPLLVGKEYGKSDAVSVELYRNVDNFEATRGFSARRSGILAQYMLGRRHTFGWTGELCENTPAFAAAGGGERGAASLSVREQAGKSVMSALNYAYRVDSRDSKLDPTCGGAFQWHTRVAGLLGSVRHVSNRVNAQYHWTLPGSVVASVLGRAGWLQPLGGTRRRAAQSRINDRFFLGDPASVHGFAADGVGPRDGSDSLGSDMFACAALHLSAPLPSSVPEWIRVQAFGQVATAAHCSIAGRVPMVAQLASSPRATVGAGVVINLLSQARLEFNVLFAHRAQPSDVPVRWEIGLAADWQ